MQEIFSVQNFTEDVILSSQVIWDGTQYKAKYYCLSCFRNKRKCNKQLPTCYECSRRDIGCTYRKDQKGLFNFKKQSNMLMLKERYFKPQKAANKLIIHTQKQGLYEFMLKGSHIDDKSLKIFLRKDGRLDYLGYSPAGPLILNYINLNQLKGRDQVKYKFEHSKPSSANNAILFKESNLFKLNIMKSCIDHYFYYFCILFPVLDEKYLQENPDPLLLKIVAAIGCRYVKQELIPKNLMQQLQMSILSEFNHRFLKPSYTICICISLILQFKMLENGFKSVWLFLSISSIYPHLLGLNHSPPFKLNKRELRLRFNVWSAIFIQDKLKIFMVNRSANLFCEDWKVAYPEYLNIPRLTNNCTNYEFIIARDTLSSCYTVYMCQLTDLVGHVDAFQKKYIIEQPNLAEQRAIKIINRSHQIANKFHKELNIICANQPLWITKLYSPLLAFFTLVKESICLNLIQNFLPKRVIKYDNMVIQSCYNIYEILKQQDASFMITYSTYSFYCITLSSLLLHFLSKHNKNQSELQGLVNKNIRLLQQYRQFSPVVQEFLDQILTLV